MTHIERRQREKEEQRKAIMDAAIAIASKEGWQAVTIRRIAEAIEYAPPIVYEYFDNKEALFTQLVYKGFGLLHSEYIKAKSSEPDPKKLLRLLSVAHWNFSETNKELFQLMFNLERPLPNEEMQNNFKLLEELFLELAHGNNESADVLMISWVFMNHGAFTIMMQLPPPKDKFSNMSAFDVYVKALDRFIYSI